MSSMLATNASGDSKLSIQMPSSPPSSRAVSSSWRASQTANGTMTLPAGMARAAISSALAGDSPVILNSTTLPACLRTGSSFTGYRTSVQASSRTRSPTIILAMGYFLYGVFCAAAVYMGFEWLDAQSAHGIQEVFLGGAFFQVDFDKSFDRIGHFVCRKRRTDDRAERSVVTLRAADADLVPLRFSLVDAQNADVTDMVMAAGVHAAGDVDIDFTDIVQIIEIVEATLNRFGNRDRLGVGKRAEITAGAAHDVSQQADIRCRQTSSFCFFPEQK